MEAASEVAPEQGLTARRAEGFFLVDADQRIVGWSRGIEEILGVSSREALGRPCYELMRRFHARDPLPCMRDCRPLRAARGGEVAICLVRREHTLGAWSLLHEAVTTPEGERVLHRLRDASLDVISIRFLRRVLEALEEDAMELRQAREAAYADNLVLTRRETEVLRLLAEGLDTRSIAERLSISYFTARNYIQSVLTKLNAHNRVEAVLSAQRLGLLGRDRQRTRPGR